MTAMCSKLTLLTLFTYLEATPNSRNVREGEAVLNAGHIILCGIRDNFNEKSTKIMCLCLQTSAIASPPHEIDGSFRKIDENWEVMYMKCTCKAGLGGKCKHIAAALLYLTRNDISNLEILSSTDVKCWWTQKKNESVEQYKPVPVQEFHMEQGENRAPSPNITEEKTQAFRKITAELLPNCALSVHWKRCAERLKLITKEHLGSPSGEPPKQSDAIKSILENAYQSEAMVKLGESGIPRLKNCCFETYKNLNFVDVEEICLTTLHDKQAWIQERQFRITGSRCYSIYTYIKANHTESDWAIKSSKYFWPKQFFSRNTKYGFEFEGRARDLYRRNLSRDVQEIGLVISKHNPFLAYSPDGIVIEAGKPTKLLEIKCPVKGKDVPAVELYHHCDYLIMNENLNMMLKKKHIYYGQVQLGMAILNLKSCDFIVYSSAGDGSFLNIIVNYDEEFTTELLLRLKEAYFSHMIHNICTNETNKT